MGESGKRKRDEWERDQEPEQGYPEYRVKVRYNPSSDSQLIFYKWAGYDSDEDSWEPTKNVAACQRLLSSFWNEIGLDDNHYDHGYVFTASKKWIEMEQRRFKAEFPQNRKYKTKQKDRAEQPGLKGILDPQLYFILDEEGGIVFSDSACSVSAAFPVVMG
ncbi:hypothetical protein B0H10DRAFT_1963927 [Mycena sp. CBHHK59/15]|nr:hypothetical protein B0H10DRAFT_1963927 [Mycena sp. CBHHK59/15]